MVDGTTIADVPVVEKCIATLPVSASDKRLANLSLRDADHYSQTDASQKYALNQDKLDVYLTSAEAFRVRLPVFDYAGECPGGSNAYKTFQELLRTKAYALRGMFAMGDHRFDYLSHLNLVATGETLDLSDADVEKYSNQTSSLQVLSGLCFAAKGTEVMHSQVFSGTLHGDLPEPLVADLPLLPQEFGTTRDIHTASLLYALAQDARRRGMDQDIVIGYLAQAREKSSQIREPAGKQMMSAIDAMLLQNGAKKPMELPQ
jgi:hypothetical protein